MHTKTQKITYPSQDSCNPLEAIIVSPVHKTTRPLPKFRAAMQTNATDRDSRADRTAPISKRFLFPNITYIFIIHSGPVTRIVRTCPECKNRYAKHACIKALSHGAIFLATCNAILPLVDVKLANTR